MRGASCRSFCTGGILSLLLHRAHLKQHAALAHRAPERAEQLDGLAQLALLLARALCGSVRVLAVQHRAQPHGLQQPSHLRLQLRLHLQALGHPILGDALYGVPTQQQGCVSTSRGGAAWAPLAGTCGQPGDSDTLLGEVVDTVGVLQATQLVVSTL
jgi:hypothetical protein